MLQSKMIIYADFPEWDSYSDPVKSLINFFMKESSCFFKGSYSGNVLQSMSGNVRFNLHPIMQIDDDPSEFSLKESVELDIAYTNQNIPSTASDFLPDCNTTLEVKNTFLKVCKIDTENVETYTGGIAPLDSIPVILTPKVDDVVHTNPTARPKNLNTNPDNIVEVPIYTENVDFNATYQLRSSSFYIKDANTGLGADVYYKIGICPLDKKYPYKNFSDTPVTPGVSLADIKSLIQNDELYLNIDDTYIEGLFYKLLQCTLATEKDSFNSGVYGFVSSIIVPIVNDSNQIIGIGYIKLFNQDGTEYDTDIKDKTIKIYCRPDEEEDPEFVKMGDQYGLHLTITDQMLDGGYIQTQYTPVPEEYLEPFNVENLSQFTISMRTNVSGGDNIWEYSYDLATWEDCAGENYIDLTQEHQRLYFRAKTKKPATTRLILGTFSSRTNHIALHGNINSLLSPNYESIEDLTPYGSYCFYQLFYKNVNVEDASDLKLPAKVLTDYCYAYMFFSEHSFNSTYSNLAWPPKLPATNLAPYCYANMFSGAGLHQNAVLPTLPATTLAEGCYSGMFANCKYIWSTPELPATTLTKNCYSSMFYNCQSLRTPPTLPATVLAESCYQSMFRSCNELTTAPSLPATTLAKNCYAEMFWSTRITTAPSLPATTLAEGCYHDMFDGCSFLTNPPTLPATTLAKSCYDHMFWGCTSLVNAPSLPATTLEEKCYQGMFRNCTSLVNAPSLPATTLAPYCYYIMFRECTSLVNAPSLPATNLAEWCYSGMFALCSAITTAPSLPATTLYDNCYSNMFDGCTSLSTPPASLPATTLAPYCYKEMFNNCSAIVHSPSCTINNVAEHCCEKMFFGCTSLVDAPTLSATTLAESCYFEMFYACTSLTTAPDLPAITLVNNCYFYMFDSCRSLTYIKLLAANNLTGNTIGVVSSPSGDIYCTQAFYDEIGIPSGWTVHII